MHSYQEPKSPQESHPSARRREPQAGAGQTNGPALLSFGWTLSENRLLCQPEVGFQAGLDTGSAGATVRGFRVKSNISLRGDLDPAGHGIPPIDPGVEDFF